jgi:hypothetical protein
MHGPHFRTIFGRIVPVTSAHRFLLFLSWFSLYCFFIEPLPRPSKGFSFHIESTQSSLLFGLRLIIVSSLRKTYYIRKCVCMAKLMSDVSRMPARSGKRNLLGISATMRPTSLDRRQAFGVQPPKSLINRFCRCHHT